MIIGICGLKRSGKDTVADFITNGYGYDKQSLARPMKEALKAIFGWTDDHLDGEYKETIDQAFGISPRQALQHIGTEWGQFGLMDAFPKFKEATGRKIWVRRLCNQIIQVDSVWAGTVVADIRFPHEVEEFRHVFGGNFKLIHVSRYINAPVDNHPSEAFHDQLGADYDLFNDGTLKQLGDAVDHIMDDIGHS